jgi:hypothetical protein
MAEPKIYTKNYVNADDTFTVSHGSSSITNAYDRDKQTQYVSSGANSDGTTVTIEIVFKEGSVAVNRTIDRLILINHNLADYTLYYWDGSAWVEWLEVDNESDTNSVKTLASQTTSKVKLELEQTIVADAEKAIGEIVLCALQIDIGQDLKRYRVTWPENVANLKLGDGSVQRQIKRFTANRYEKYHADVSFDLLPVATIDAIFTIRKAGNPFLWHPESSTRPDELYYVDWDGDYRYEYASDYKTAGFRLDFSVAEV